MVGSVYRDMDDVFSGGHWSKGGQKHHFMRFQGQSALAAFQVASKWIYDNAFTAATRLREIWTQKRGYVNPIYIQEPLGNAVHAIQDSYAEGHVTRKKEGHDYIIVDVLIYDDANRKATANWPGHAALDQRWKTSELGKEAVIATRELVRIVVVSSLQETEPEFRTKWSSLWNTYVSVFLQCRFSAAASR